MNLYTVPPNVLVGVSKRTLLGSVQSICFIYFFANSFFYLLKMTFFQKMSFCFPFIIVNFYFCR